MAIYELLKLVLIIEIKDSFGERAISFVKFTYDYGLEVLEVIKVLFFNAFGVVCEHV